MSFADDSLWTGAVDNDFLNAANWEGGVPDMDDDLAVINNGANLPVVIPESAETITIGGFQLGRSGETGGHVIQNGGTLIVAPFGLEGLPTDFEFKSHIGDQGTLDSSWIMNNNAVLLYDGPADADGFGLDAAGENEFDLEIGAQAGEAMGRLELHDNAVLRVSDDLKIGAEDNGNGFVLIDGNATASMGSGISVGERENGHGVLEIAGNALVVSGNSAGPGQADAGYTDEGYLTLSTNATGTATVSVSDSARLYARTLQQRDGVSNLTVGDSAQFHVFDVFNFEEPDLGTATVLGSTGGAQRTSVIGANPSADITITIKDDGAVSIDSDLDDSSWNGLAMSGGTNRGDNADGGRSLIEVQDRGSFIVQQDLNMTIGTGIDAASTLRVTGPDAQVAINGNLYMALDPNGDFNDGDATIHAVITGNSHGTIAVGGEADISNGLLAVELSGYQPRGGETYTLLAADSLVGDSFLDVDLSMAELPEGLDWLLSLDDNAVMLTVEGMLEGILGDFNSVDGLDLADLDLLVSAVQAGTDMSFDLNGDSTLEAADIAAWLELKSEADGGTFLPGDTDLDGMVAFSDFLQLSNNFGDVSGTWSQGNFDGVGGTAFADFLALSENFGAGQGALASVPEPNSGCFLVAFVFAGLCCRRNRQS